MPRIDIRRLKKKETTMFKRLAYVAFAFFIVFYLCTCGKVNEYQSESTLWSVTAKNPRFERNFGVGYNKLDGLVIDLHIQYLGPDTKRQFPRIYLIEGESKDKIYPASGTTGKNDQATDKLIHLIIGHSDALFDLKQGEYLTNDPIAILWEVEQFHSCWLHVGDTPVMKIF
jgi:hypothetical protein